MVSYRGSHTPIARAHFPRSWPLSGDALLPWQLTTILVEKIRAHPFSTSRNETQQVTTMVFSEQHSNPNSPAVAGVEFLTYLQTTTQVTNEPRTDNPTTTKIDKRSGHPFHPRKYIWMAKKHIRRTSLVIREKQMKTTMKWHYVPIGMSQIKQIDNTNCRWGCGATGALIHCWQECNLVQQLWKTNWQPLINLHLPSHPAIALLSIYPREMKTYFSFCLYTETCTQMFTVVLFIKTKKLETRSKCPSTVQWVNQLIYLCNRILLSKEKE